MEYSIFKINEDKIDYIIFGAQADQYITHKVDSWYRPYR